MKAGQPIKVKGFDLAMNKTFEAAKVARVTRVMRPVPDGYVPVRFDADKAVLMVHRSNIVVVEN